MKNAIQWLRSLIFVGVIYVMLLVVGIVYLPWAVVSSNGAFAAAHFYCRMIRFLAPWMIGVKTEVRGTPPTDEVIVAAKHQSFLDIILIYGAIPRGKFIMKREILWTPVIGLYGLRMGCVAVNRGKRGAAIKKMVESVASGKIQGGQLIIYPQGTRVKPGVQKPYKIGPAVLYKELNQECVPVACNVGLFWPKSGIMYHPGTAVVEFLPRIPAGLPVEEFMERLETSVETRSNELMRDGGLVIEETAG